jgi:hypothetical protein
MRTETRTLYTFEELDAATQQRVIDHYRRTAHHSLWGWSEEWWESARAFNRIAPIDITEADYTNRYITTRWTGTEELAMLSGVRAWKWLQANGWFDLAAKNAAGSCTLTGYCGDCPLFDPIESVRQTPATIRSLKDLFESCARRWLEEAADDCDYAYTDDAIRDTLMNDDQEYTDDGRNA